MLAIIYYRISVKSLAPTTLRRAKPRLGFLFLSPDCQQVEGFLRTLIGCLYLRCVTTDAWERRRGVARGRDQRVRISAPSPPLEPLRIPVPVFGGFFWRRAGKHSQADGWSLSHHLEYITVTLQSPPKQGLAMAKNKHCFTTALDALPKCKSNPSVVSVRPCSTWLLPVTQSSALMGA